VFRWSPQGTLYVKLYLAVSPMSYHRELTDLRRLQGFSAVVGYYSLHSPAWAASANELRAWRLFSATRLLPPYLRSAVAAQIYLTQNARFDRRPQAAHKALHWKWVPTLARRTLRERPVLLGRTHGTVLSLQAARCERHQQCNPYGDGWRHIRKVGHPVESVQHVKVKLLHLLSS
jgi:hypothetical protein